MYAKVYQYKFPGISEAKVAAAFCSDYLGQKIDEHSFHGLSILIGQEGDLTILIKFDDVKKLKPSTSVNIHLFEPEMANTLKDACYYFWVSTAAKICRLGKSKPTTMFVHTHVRHLMHQKTTKLIDDFRVEIKKLVDEDDKELMSHFEEMWKNECLRVTRKDDEREIKFEETTVTLQSMRPSMPTIIMPATAQHANGIATQRNFRKIIPKAKMISKTTAILKVRKSA